MHAQSVYSALHILEWQLAAVSAVLMTQERWWKRYTTFYAIQLAQLAWMNVGLYLWLTRNPAYTVFREETFWPNVALEAIIVAYCFRKALMGVAVMGWVGAVFLVHAQARLVHWSSYDTHPSLGWEYAVSELASTATYLVVLWAVYSSRGDIRRRKPSE